MPDNKPLPLVSCPKGWRKTINHHDCPLHGSIQVWLRPTCTDTTPVHAKPPIVCWNARYSHSARTSDKRLPSGQHAHPATPVQQPGKAQAVKTDRPPVLAFRPRELPHRQAPFCLSVASETVRQDDPVTSCHPVAFPRVAGTMAPWPSLERTIALPPSGWQCLPTGGCRIRQGKPVERMWTRHRQGHFKGLSLGHESKVKGERASIPSARCASRICPAWPAVPFRENSHNFKVCGQGIEKHNCFVTGSNRGFGDSRPARSLPTVADGESDGFPASARCGAGFRRRPDKAPPPRDRPRSRRCGRRPGGWHP